MVGISNIFDSIEITDLYSRSHVIGLSSRFKFWCKSVLVDIIIAGTQMTIFDKQYLLDMICMSIHKRGHDIMNWSWKVQ